MIPPIPFFPPFAAALPPFQPGAAHPGPPSFGAPPPPFLPPAASGVPGRRRPYPPPPHQGHDGRPLSTTTLAVENVPRDALTSANVRHFFEQFGVVTSVAVDPPGLRALVTFETPEHAKRALTSPEAVFGNRFVRVYRAREVAGGPNLPRPETPTGTPSPAVGTTAPSSPTAATSSSLARRSADLHDQPSETASRATLMQENASAQKALMDQLESLPAGDASQKSSIMSALRKLSSEAAALAKPSAPSSVRPSGVSPEERLASLRQEVSDSKCFGRADSSSIYVQAAALGIDPSAGSSSSYATLRGRARGRGGYRGGSSMRGRGGLPRSFRLDNRVTKIVVGDVDLSAPIPTLRSYFEVSLGVSQRYMQS